MKFYLAPMEGITGYIYRNAYAKFFNNIDKYFTPFIEESGGNVGLGILKGIANIFVNIFTWVRDNIINPI